MVRTLNGVGANVELWHENKNGAWTRSALQIMYVADELYPNKPPEHGLKRFFYQYIGWHWDTTSKQLKRGHHPHWYNAAGYESISQHELEQDADDISMERDPRFELQLEDGYHQNRMQLSAIDALWHRVTDDAVIKWLNGGPRPRDVVSLSPGSRPYLIRGATRSMEAGESSRPQQGLHLHPASSGTIDLDSDSDWELL